MDSDEDVDDAIALAINQDVTTRQWEAAQLQRSEILGQAKTQAFTYGWQPVVDNGNRNGVHELEELADWGVPASVTAAIDVPVESVD